ncbi:hypothetical protein J3459_011485 [Metarhizium acridum]|nr:hypothetical protein J3459_011485 [Metarhizium acridum]
MSKITKIKWPRMTDDDLKQHCREQLQCGECSITWRHDLPKGTRIQPPANTFLIVIDVPENKGAIRVFDSTADKHLGTVGTEDAGYMVGVPWDINWWFRVSGSLNVGYIMHQEES